MPVLTVTTVIQLPADEWERADLVAKCRPVPDIIRKWLTDNGVEGVVEHSFDGRKARAPTETKDTTKIVPSVPARHAAE